MSCLFDTLSHFVKDIDAYTLRQIICDFLEKNPTLMDNIPVNDIIQWTNDTDLNTYIKKMRLHSEWGSSLEIISFCNLMKCKVNVEHKRKKIEFIPNKPAKYEITIGYTGNHYFHK